MALERAFIPSYLAGIPFNGSLNLADYHYSPAPVDPRTDEDCLFLDVLVPKEIYQSRGRSQRHRGAPVLVWIYGGGYAFGDKTTQTGSPGLIARSKQDGSEGLIYVSFNYRVSLVLARLCVIPFLTTLLPAGSFWLASRSHVQQVRHTQCRTT
jgi:hypothetical protein